MRLSDAILLGRNLLSHLECGDTAHCAVGMALQSNGIVPLGRGHDTMDYHNFMRLFPWTMETGGVECPWCPSSCEVRLHGSEIVWHPFDTHVMDGCFQKITLEQFADWLRTIEPDDTVPTTDTATPQVEEVWLKG